MRSLALPLVLLLVALLTGCRKPVPASPPPFRLVVRFLDRDAVLALPAVPPEGDWRVMNAGQWEPLDVRWRSQAPRIGVGVVGRTAPDWVLLEDPVGESHRVVMRGPGPEELVQRNGRLDPDEVDALAAFGILWALVWSGR